MRANLARYGRFGRLRDLLAQHLEELNYGNTGLLGLIVWLSAVSGFRRTCFINRV